RLLDDDAAGLVAGLLYAVYAQAIFYDGLLLTPSLVNFLLVLSLLGLARNSRAWVLLASVAIGLAILVRANLLLLPPLVAIGLFRSAGRRAAVSFLAAALALPALVIAVNGVAHGSWAPVSANGGMNLWTGNRRGAVGVYEAPDFLTTQRAAEEEAGFLD